jgi:hypothetical protein
MITIQTSSRRTRRRWRTGVCAVAGSLIALGALSACGAAGPDPSDPAAGAPVALQRIEESDHEDVASALDDPAGPDLPTPLVDPAALVSGGPPPDGIPAIDEPLFERASSVTWLDADEPVLSLQVGGEARAYPVRVMIWHEIVNDLVAGVPIAVTYCPLCNSALTFDRRVGDRILSFGVSGLLYQSDLVMFDRQTESLWPQLEGRAVAGVLTGTDLEKFPVQTVAWSDFQSAHPESWVLSQETGFLRNYGANPYVGYDDVGTDPFLFDGEVPDRLPAKARVVGLGGDVDPVAIPRDRLEQEGLVVEEVEGRPVVAWLVPGLRSALDTEELDEGRQIGAVAVYEPRWDGTDLTFRPDDRGGLTDEQTGSTWNVLGQATAGPAMGAQLDPVEHVDTFWFAWAAFRPETRLAS